MKITVKDIVKPFEEKMPTTLAEDWDNVGLQIGSLQTEVMGILTTLDVTKEAIDYAIKHNCNFIFSHHPLIFKGVKQIHTDSYVGSMISKLIRHKITVYSAHTNLDVAIGGLNDMAASRLGLEQVRGLAKRSDDEMVKIVVFTPKSHSHQVRMAMAEAGAGWIGAYSHCSYSGSGTGRFKPLKGTNPYIGTLNEIEEVEEERIETICRKKDISPILKALFQVHPYEEVAYDIYPLLAPMGSHYLGRVGELPQEMPLKDFSDLLKRAFPKGNLRFAGAKRHSVKRIALCTGSAAEFMTAAVSAGADVYITGDVKYHDGQRAKELGLLIADAGHFGTEEFVALGLKEIVQGLLPKEWWSEIRIEAYTDQEDFFFTL